MLRSTVRHGYSVPAGEPAPRSGPGPVTGSPSRVICPPLTRVSPAIIDSSVDFPEPLAPTTQTPDSSPTPQLRGRGRRSRGGCGPGPGSPWSRFVVRVHRSRGPPPHPRPQRPQRDVDRDAGAGRKIRVLRGGRRARTTPGRHARSRRPRGRQPPRPPARLDPGVPVVARRLRGPHRVADRGGRSG